MLERHPRRQLYPCQTSEHREITERVDSETPRETPLGEHYRGNRRADDPRQIEAARVERYRIDEIFTRHELHHHRLARGDLERRDHPSKSRQRQKPLKAHVT